ncbi:MAG: transcription termination factor NusA [Cytophagales bacterium]|nr:transcription termination factor NusA [Cytophagales bacterium]
MEDRSDLFHSFREFAKQKNIEGPVVIRIIQDVFRAMIRRDYEDDTNFDVTVNAEKGDLEIWRLREIVDDNSEDIWDLDKIKLSDARKIEPDFEVGEEVAEQIPFSSFGRRTVLMGRQALSEKLRNLERELLVQKYTDLVGEIVSAEVHHPLSRETFLLDAEGNELVLPISEQIPKDRFRKGESVRALVQTVEVGKGAPRIVLSRTSPLFLKRLFESEVPEIYEGVINIKKVVRAPGERAKVAVESLDDRIDPVGACVGIRGLRIHSIVRELCNENIDVINYTENPELYIMRSLSPAKIESIQIDDERKRVSVSLLPDQVSLAIGRKGQNINLAGQLIGMEIDVFRETEQNDEEEDVNLKEFEDEIEGWIIHEMRKVGLDTAKSVLALPKEEFLRRTDLEEETADEIFKILKKEFE